MPPEQLLPSAASAEGGDRAEAGEVLMVRRSAVAACVTCGLCGGILRDPTTVSKCLHSSGCGEWALKGQVVEIFLNLILTHDTVCIRVNLKVSSLQHWCTL